MLTGSFMDYGMPRAHHVPSFDIALAEDPTKGNPLRVKGGGEAGITPALAVVMNAIMDALKDYGVEHIDMPATPHRIWSAIQGAKGTSMTPQKIGVIGAGLMGHGIAYLLAAAGHTIGIYDPVRGMAQFAAPPAQRRRATCSAATLPCSHAFRCTTRWRRP